MFRLALGMLAFGLGFLLARSSKAGDAGGGGGGGNGGSVPGGGGGALTFDLSTLRGVQLALLGLRYSLGPRGADGVAGPATRAAVAAFQRDHRMAVTEKIDLVFTSALTSALRKNGFVVIERR